MRKASLDVCRVLACLMVILGHTGMLFWEFDPASPVWAAYNLLFIVLRSSVLLFFMVSGALFLGREKLDFKRHMQRAGHMLALFYAWSLITNGIDALFLHYWTAGENVWKLVLQGYFHLWFLPTMALCYCALPLLHGLAHGNRGNIEKGALLMAGIVTLYSTLRLLPDESGWLAAFLKPYDLSYFRYFAMMPLGWVLYQKTLDRRQLGILGLAALFAVLLMAWGSRRYCVSIGQPSDRFYEDLSVSSVLTACLLFCACKRIETLPPRIAGLVKLIAAGSLGMYLMHPVFIDFVRSRHWDLTRYSAVLLYPAFYACFVLVPLALSLALLKIPGLRKLVS